MENILINSIEVKPSGLVIVRHATGEATLNTKWQEQEVNYLQNDVGIGGNVNVEIVVKGQYTNITKVDMASGKKGTGKPLPGLPVCKKSETVPNLKDEKILGAVLLKGAVEMTKGHNFANLTDEAKYMCECVNELYGVYKVALDVQK